jgi:hypothetical protein
MPLMCLKIFWKSIDKKALRPGRHLMLLFPPPKIMLFREKTSRKFHFLLKFCIVFFLRYVLVNVQYDKLGFVFSVLRVSPFYAVLTKISFRKRASYLAQFACFYYPL